jgi:hypothetical protein
MYVLHRLMYPKASIICIMEVKNTTLLLHFLHFLKGDCIYWKLISIPPERGTGTSCQLSGPERARTAYLFVANEAFYRVNYGPQFALSGPEF